MPASHWSRRNTTGWWRPTTFSPPWAGSRPRFSVCLRRSTTPWSTISRSGTRGLAFASPMGGNEIRRRQDEVKYDGYRMMLIRKQGRVQLIGRGGHDWARRFPLIVTAALKLRQEHFVIDGETVVVGLDGGSDFGALHSGGTTSGRSSMPSTCSQATAKASAGWRSRCAKTTSHACSGTASPAYSSPSTSRVTSAAVSSAI